MRFNCLAWLATEENPHFSEQHVKLIKKMRTDLHARRHCYYPEH